MKRILVVVTTSPASRLALDEAITLAKQNGARLRLVRVLGMRRPSLTILRAEDWLERLEHGVPLELRDGFAPLIGPGPLAIRRAAEAYHADVVIFAARAHAALVRGGVDPTFVDRVGPKLVIVRPYDQSGAAISTASPAHGHDGHSMLEATTLAGAATGAVAGAIAGPAGAFVGAGIGAAIGMLAGRALETADDGADQHDQELDNDIGVTHGSMGLGGVNTRPSGTQEADSLALAGQLLAREHAHLEQIYDALLGACAEGDWTEVRAEWALFEPGLRAHMATEERAIFPSFGESNPTVANALLAEHAKLRAVLDELAISVELHTLSLNEAEALLLHLREHARREEELLYPWVDSAVPRKAVKPLAA